MKPGIPQRPVSIKDIARAAGVSHSTVSRALRGSPLITAQTREMIQQKASEMGYQASAIARSLVTQRTLTIGVVVTSIADPFNGGVVSGIEEVANRHGYSVILANSQTDPDREVRVVRGFQERRVDGVLVTASRVGALYLSVMSEMRVPVVLINNQHPGEFLHAVAIENVEAAQTATKHLIDLGHRSIGYIGDHSGYQSELERMAGYRQALFASGIAFRSELVCAGDGGAEQGTLAMRQLLTSGAGPTAVFCYNDRTAMGALQAAVELGIRVPEELSIVGFDDLFFAPYLRPALTTIRQPKEEMGRQAMRLLLSLFAGETSPRTIHVQGELIVRASTGPPPVG